MLFSLPTVADMRIALRTVVRFVMVAGSLAALTPRASAEAATITVPSGESFQSALDRAVPGDTIQLEAGATFVGPFTLPNKGPSDSYITITTTNIAALPAAGKRVGPANAGAMPKLVSQTPGVGVVYAAFGAHHYRFIGVEITASVEPIYSLVELGINGFTGAKAASLDQLQHHITFERVYIHGTPSLTIRRAFFANAINFVLLDSYCSEIHDNADSQCVLGTNSPGPFLIRNNYLEAAGENIMFGGDDPEIPGLVPSDIVVDRNYMTKKLTWKVDDGSYAGYKWAVKNVFELKNGQRVQVTNNVIERSWTDAQTGHLIVLQPVSQYNRAPWTTVNTVTFANNIIRHGNSAVSVRGAWNADVLRDVTFRNNLFYDVTRFTMMSDSVSPGVRNFVYDHNTIDIRADNGLMLFGNWNSGNPQQFPSFVFTNNLVRADHGIFFDNLGTDVVAGLANYAKGGYTFNNNAIATQVNTVPYPASTQLPGASDFYANFIDAPGRDYRLVAASAYKNAGTDGLDLGANMNNILGNSTTTSAPNPPTNVKIVSTQ